MPPAAVDLHQDLDVRVAAVDEPLDRAAARQRHLPLGCGQSASRQHVEELALGDAARHDIAGDHAHEHAAELRTPGLPRRATSARHVTTSAFTGPSLVVQVVEEVEQALPPEARREVDDDTSRRGERRIRR